MTYARKGNNVTLEMTTADYNELLMLLGYTTGEAMKDGDKEGARWRFDFINRLNRTNPHFTPYALAPRDSGGQKWSDPISVDKNAKVPEN
jgi:hypothetical protein